jgi:EF-P beta-lysylation protein EpmB
MNKSSRPTKRLHETEPESVLTWRQELARAFSSVSELLTELELDDIPAGVPRDILLDFPLRVPRGYVSRMRKGDAKDPLLRQILPLADEAQTVPGYSLDPVGDLASSRGRGVLQKYHGRALLMVTGACAVHCRYCFRRAYPYHEAALPAGQIDAAVGELRGDDSIEEVILSGGDPLSLTDNRLETLLAALSRIPHLKRIRIHTRVPVVLPERVDSSLTNLLARTTKPVIIVLHCNHANEIDGTVANAISRLSDHTALLLNQAVLLRGVNDSAATLVALSERLFEVGVLPYYLHQLDPVIGAAHFEVDDNKARQLIGAAAAMLPGYLVPKLVREIHGASAKTLLTPIDQSHQPVSSIHNSSTGALQHNRTTTAT